SADAAPTGRRTTAARRNTHNFLKAVNMTNLLGFCVVFRIILTHWSFPPPPFSPPHKANFYYSAFENPAIGYP
ncbi:MAG: hypothetical protein ACFNW0_04430, partial [Fretibacterium sp.]